MVWVFLFFTYFANIRNVYGVSLVPNPPCGAFPLADLLLSLATDNLQFPSPLSCAAGQTTTAAKVV